MILRTLKFNQKLLVYVLSINLFLQSCDNSFNQLIPQKKESTDDTLRSSKDIHITPLVGQQLVVSGGNLVTFYEQDGRLQARVRFDEKQPEPNYKGVPVLVEEGTNLSNLTKLDSTTQQGRIELVRSHSGQLRYITIRKGGLSGGMYEYEQVFESEEGYKVIFYETKEEGWKAKVNTGNQEIHFPVVNKENVSLEEVLMSDKQFLCIQVMSSGHVCVRIRTVEKEKDEIAETERKAEENKAIATTTNTTTTTTGTNFQDLYEASMRSDADLVLQLLLANEHLVNELRENNNEKLERITANRSLDSTVLRILLAAVNGTITTTTGTSFQDLYEASMHGDADRVLQLLLANEHLVNELRENNNEKLERITANRSLDSTVLRILLAAVNGTTNTVITTNTTNLFTDGRAILKTLSLWNGVPNEMAFYILPESNDPKREIVKFYFSRFAESIYKNILTERLRKCLDEIPEAIKEIPELERDKFFESKCQEIDRLIRLGADIKNTEFFEGMDAADYYAYKLGGLTNDFDVEPDYDHVRRAETGDLVINEIEDEVCVILRRRTGYYKKLAEPIFLGRINMKLIIDYTDSINNPRLDQQIEIFCRLKNNENEGIKVDPEDLPQYLCWATEEGNIELANLLREKGADVNVKVKYGWTPLHIAVQKEHLEFVKWLLALGVKINTQDDEGNTSLHMACELGYVEIVNFLLNQGAIFVKKNRDEKTPIDLAEKEYYTQIVDILTRKKEEYIRELLELNSTHNDSILGGLIKSFIHYINDPDKIINPALSLAAREGHIGIVRLLIQLGANIDTICPTFGSPLHSATEKGHVEIAKLLINLGAYINIINHFGNTPLDTAIAYNKSEIIELLSKNGGLEARYIRNLRELSESESESEDEDDYYDY